MHLFPLPPISPVGFGLVTDCELAEVGGPLLGLPARPEKYWVENSGPIPVAARRTSAVAYLSSEQAGSAEPNRVDTSPHLLPDQQLEIGALRARHGGVSIAPPAALQAIKQVANPSSTI